MTPKMKRLLDEALKYMGRNHQVFLAVEELAELQKELLKEANRGRGDLDKIIDETADVFIVLEQILNIYQIHDAVRERITAKLDRMDKRLEYHRKKEVEDGIAGN